MFSNKKYEKVKIFEKAESNSKLIVTQDFGIVGFIDKNDKEWALVEDNTIQQTEPIIINGVCE